MFCMISNVYAAESLKEAFTEGTPYADVRLRYEFVDQDGLAQNANTKTARTRLGFKTDKFHDFNADDGGLDHGSEWGIYLKQPISEHVYVETKYVNYNADNTLTDTQKFIFGVGIQY